MRRAQKVHGVKACDVRRAQRAYNVKVSSVRVSEVKVCSVRVCEVKVEKHPMGELTNHKIGFDEAVT